MKWFQKLTSQEQSLIKFGLLIVIPVMIWKLVYLPIVETYQSKVLYKGLLNSQYQTMLASREQLSNQMATQQNYHRDNNKLFIAWIDEQLTKNSLSQYVVRSEPKDSKTLILTFENVAFDDLIQWLEPLEENFSIKISEVDVNITDKLNGLCSARITLEDK